MYVEYCVNQQEMNPLPGKSFQRRCLSDQAENLQKHLKAYTSNLNECAVQGILHQMATKAPKHFHEYFDDLDPASQDASRRLRKYIKWKYDELISRYENVAKRATANIYGIEVRARRHRNGHLDHIDLQMAAMFLQLRIIIVFPKGEKIIMAPSIFKGRIRKKCSIYLGYMGRFDYISMEDGMETEAKQQQQQQQRGGGGGGGGGGNAVPHRRSIEMLPPRFEGVLSAPTSPKSSRQPISSRPPIKSPTRMMNATSSESKRTNVVTTKNASRNVAPLSSSSSTSTSKSTNVSGYNSKRSKKQSSQQYQSSPLVSHPKRRRV
eukprot:jgi/Bigna1/137362/aug1.38_g12070